MYKKKFYVVKVGRRPGVYNTWEECKAQVDGVLDAKFKGFETMELALAWQNDALPIGYPSIGLCSDGGSSGNPGPLCAKVYDLAAKKLLWTGPDKPMTGTNNQAEFIALGKALSLALDNDVIYVDSNTVISWVTSNGYPTVDVKWLEKARGLLYSKNITIMKWRKDLWGEAPADCK